MLKIGKTKAALRDTLGDILDGFKLKGKIDKRKPLNNKDATLQAKASSFKQDRKRKKLK